MTLEEAMLTANSISDEQIRELHDDVVLCIWPIHFQDDHFIDAPDGRGGYYEPDDIVNWCINARGVDNNGSALEISADTRTTSRTRCAEVLNTRKQE
jgi:hypothetical protein